MSTFPFCHVLATRADAAVPTAERAISRRVRLWVAILLSGYFLIAYLPLGRRALRVQTYETGSALDALIPFYPLAVWPYLLAIPMLLLPVWLIRERNLFLQTFVAAAFVMTATFAMFFLFPTSSELLLPNDRFRASGISGWLIERVAHYDRPSNLAPSLHVSLATVGMIALTRQHDLFAKVLIVLIWSIVVSSVCLIKQHHVFDVLSGAALGAFLFCASGRFAAVHRRQS